MSTVKINNKNYTIPELSFRHMTQMEDMGFDIIRLFQNRAIFSLATAFTSIVTELNREQSEELLQQHILGGGDLEQIYEKFVEALDESAFFKKLLNLGEEPVKKTTKKTEAAKK